MVLVNFDDLAAHVAGNLAQLTFLVGRGLIDGRDSQIENGAFIEKLWFLMPSWRARKADLLGIFGTVGGAEVSAAEPGSQQSTESGT